MKRRQAASLFAVGAGPYFRKRIKAKCKVVGQTKGWTLPKLNQLARQIMEKLA